MPFSRRTGLPLICAAMLVKEPQRAGIRYSRPEPPVESRRRGSIADIRSRRGDLGACSDGVFSGRTGSVTGPIA
jgi:hypothetical protein